MHEMAITESVITAVSEKVGERRVQRVSLAVGRLSGVVAESLYFLLDLCTEGTPWRDRSSRSSTSRAVPSAVPAGPKRSWRT